MHQADIDATNLYPMYFRLIFRVHEISTLHGECLSSRNIPCDQEFCSRRVLLLNQIHLLSQKKAGV